MPAGQLGVAGTKCTVIGGGGFLGRHIVEGLLDAGYDVNVFDIRRTFEDERITFFEGNLCKSEDLAPALSGVDIVFHCASPPAATNNRALFQKVNIEGTICVIRACVANSVKRLVLTSSASVVYEGTDIANGTESLPYAHKPIDAYTETKIEQEKIVLAANNKEMLADGSGYLLTAAIRPHGIFGPNDRQLLPTLVDKARAGKMKFIIGNGENLVDFTHVRNVVHGHILAAQHLQEGHDACGQAFNITNCEPVKFWWFIGELLDGLGYSRPTIKLPYRLIYVVSLIMTFVCFVLRSCLGAKAEATFTPMQVALAGTHHYYSSAKAQACLGYSPVVNVADGIRSTLATFQHLRRK
ncbi:sterol-4-alpha-carboxylate 3-dehydrogenase, decarboxylating-like [Sycon ciliatum]|uniref:sterol-4-alpha-carboxylate 3-dehydrogenase, decarboxylating-like n=1 Tax=Sycon ciliatum TaxID=27933 RepID=UPI0020ACE19A|eukprot:scpid72174/ scgid19740/ Sterol-4-alpha-carboxylate 3-dehydrogenase, decarboxylating